jgi:tricorn protease
MESLAFSAKMAVDHYQERQQIFREAWSSLRDGFYDPQFHGRNWEALRAQYEPLALAASTAQDFRNIFNTMLGQLNASHMGMSGPSPEETQEDKTGRLGVEVVPVAGGVRVTHVVTNGPAARATSKLAEGDLIAAVNGTPITASTNLNELLNGTANERTLLLVRTGATEREVVIRPAASLRDELYEEWVAERKRLTEVYSNGRLGYIHIQGMNWPSFERFERELTASGLGKDGIVVDVRYNGGGWTTDMLMAVLNVRQHSYTVPRGAAADLSKENLQFVDHYPYGERLPLAALTKPAVALCNQNSYSNAEIFSHAFKALGRGSLVGMPTFGAVISTGSQRLLDGSAVRMPFRAWYVKATEANMEHGPAVPDFVVENAPDSKAQGEDEQLRKAVDVLLAEMK